MNYYNEFDPKAAAWLRELIKAKLIPAGDVDERSILNVPPQEVKGYTQCHFFAGIGGWSYALQLAGWPENYPVWTGSCPCQPFSTAGKQKGVNDERHIWPAFFNLIQECRPNVVFGEQVESAIRHGWLSGISTDLENADYALGAIVFGAHSLGAPHIRQRLYWVAECGLDNSGGNRTKHGKLSAIQGSNREDNGLPRASSDWGSNGVVESLRERCEGKPLGLLGTMYQNNWSRFDIVKCQDGKQRRIEPGTFPLANGVLARVELLRGYGNAIVPQAAAEFIMAYVETRTLTEDGV